MMVLVAVGLGLGLGFVVDSGSAEMPPSPNLTERLKKKKKMVQKLKHKLNETNPTSGSGREQ